MLLSMWHILLELAPWLLFGAAVAGLLHWLLPPSFVRKNMSGRSGVLKAVAVGVPLPLCSCGVIPAGLGLKKDGASDGAVVGFLTSTPQTGVDSIFVSASFLGWPFALFKVGSAFLTGLVGGFVTDAVQRRPAERAPVEPPAGTEARRTLRDGISHAFDLLRTIWRWLVMGVVASAAIEVLLPGAALAGLSERGLWLAMLGTLLIALPMYVCATASVPIAAALVAGGLPPGAALVFLMAGPASNVATIGAVYRSLGLRPLIVYLTTIALGSVGLGIAFEWVLADLSIAHVHHQHGAGGAWWAIASALALLALFVYFAFDEGRAVVSRRLKRGAAARAQTLEVSVDGMSCSKCAARLERALISAEGVASAQVSLDAKRATVRGTLSEARLRELVSGAGFKPGLTHGSQP